MLKPLPKISAPLAPLRAKLVRPRAPAPAPAVVAWLLVRQAAVETGALLTGSDPLLAISGRAMDETLARLHDDALLREKVCDHIRAILGHAVTWAHGLGHLVHPDPLASILENKDPLLDAHAILATERGMLEPIQQVRRESMPETAIRTRLMEQHGFSAHLAHYICNVASRATVVHNNKTREEARANDAEVYRHIAHDSMQIGDRRTALMAQRAVTIVEGSAKQTEAQEADGFSVKSLMAALRIAANTEDDDPLDTPLIE